MELEAIRYERGKLDILDQLLLPHDTDYIEVQNVDQGWNVIKKMQVRGAPAIAIVGSLSLAVELNITEFKSKEKLSAFVSKKMDYLVTARPTAVNMTEAAERLKKKASILCETSNLTVEDMKENLIKTIEDMLAKDINDNKAIGNYGAEAILNHHGNTPVRILTHCNTGSLATAGYGTALGVARSLHEKGMLEHVYCTETRPYNQGARLTAYEIVHEKMAGTLICDSAVALLMQQRNISAVVVGADRVVSNGDTANKIGTYQLAVVAKYHDVPFFVAAPSASIDRNLDSGDQVKIEERPHHEMKEHKGIPIAASEIDCWNPVFDVTPHDLITGGIITEVGIFRPADLKAGITRALDGIQEPKISKNS
ncbi:LOW QUALITY PROTEIN: methylthioribose-1-phosphate isomerase-like [Liolophura sinensis]|uniref:LOW QUALITY PROTEIN: methylthioribose-1-phosphate isomerase-like n=1 Tax=Liolophura sinensis TaxID=3198878 RepID=UPI003158FAB0